MCWVMGGKPDQFLLLFEFRLLQVNLPTLTRSLPQCWDRMGESISVLFVRNISKPTFLMPEIISSHSTFKIQEFLVSSVALSRRQEMQCENI